MYNWDGTKYKAVKNNNNYPLVEKKNPEIALVVLNVSADVKPFIKKGKVKVRV